MPAAASHAAVPEIIAHRGSSRECLENTMAAFDRALEQGADAIELDVHATRDGTVVVHHDPFLRDHRTGHADTIVHIAETDFAALSELRLLNFEPVPTLDAVFARVAGRAKLYVEVKGAGIEEPVLECIHRHDARPVAVHAFDHRVPHRMGASDRALETGILSASYVLNLTSMISAAGAKALWQHAALIDEALVREAAAAGARTIAWTENDVAHARALVAMGVSGLCTDTPGIMRTAFPRRA